MKPTESGEHQPHPISGNPKPSCSDHGTEYQEGCEVCTLALAVWSGHGGGPR